MTTAKPELHVFPRTLSAAMVLLSAVTALALAACGESNTTEPDPPRASAVQVTGPDSAMVGDTLHLEARVLDDDGNTMAGETVDWSSSNPAVATVTDSGEVHSLADGTVTITAAAGDASGVVDMVIWARPAPTTIAVEGPDSLMVGDTAALQVTVTDQYDRVMTGEPVRWTSSDSSIMVVDGPATVRAIAEGPARITAAAGDASGGVDMVVWARPAPATIEVNGPDSLMVGDTGALQVMVTDQYDQVMPDEPVRWTSSDPSVVVVDSPATVRAIAEGSARITAQAGDASGDLGIMVYPVPQVELESDTVLLTALGDTAVIRAELHGEPTNLVLTPLAEVPWNTGMEVSGAFEGSNVVALAAGTSQYLVESTTAAPSSPDTVVVVVAPATPYVQRVEIPAVVGPDSPLILHGYGLSGLSQGSIKAGSEAAVLSERDSASITGTFPIVPAGECIGAAATLTIAEAEVLLKNEVTLQRQREGAISLPVGGTQRLSSAEAACVMVDGPDSATFALAYFDARYAYSTTDDPRENTEQFSVTLADVSGSAGTSTGHVSSSRLMVPQWQPDGTAAALEGIGGASANLTGDEWMEQSAPYEVGDTLDIRNWLPLYRTFHEEERHEVQVVAVFDDYLTVGVPVDSMAAIPGDTLEAFVDLVRELDTRHLDWLTGLFGRPALANGQYMILVYPFDGVGAAGSAMPGWHMLRVGTLNLDGNDGVYGVLVHEYGHSLRAAFTATQRDRFGASPFGDLWTSEGLPDFLAWRARIEFAGLPFDGNVPFDPTRVTALESLTYLARGEIERGYASVAGLGFDFTWRVAEASGMPWEEAFDSVAVGINNNRYGCTFDGDCGTFDGLYDVMRRYLGTDWDPVDGTLTYVASQVLDDRVESTVYRNPYVHEASTHMRNPPLLGPQAEVSAYSGGTGTVRPRPAGSTGWTLLTGGGGAFRATSDADEMEWMLIRVE